MDTFKTNEAFLAIGLDRRIARVLPHMLNKEARISFEIQQIAEIQQPEASVALNAMLERNWVTVTSRSIGGKGRPQKVYSLCVDVNEIIDYAKQESKKEQVAFNKAIEYLESV